MAAGRGKALIQSSTVRQEGFTLVEILIAIAIFAVVISTVYGSYRATFHIIHGTETRLEVANSARIVLDRLADDLASIVTGPGGRFTGERHDYSGARGDSLSFVSASHLVLNKTDILNGHSLVEYTAELDPKTNLLDLYRSDVVLLPGTILDEEKVKKHIICRGLKEIGFTYLGRDGNDSEEWQVAEIKPPVFGQVQTASPFPALVYVELRFGEAKEKDGDTVFRTAINLP